MWPMMGSVPSPEVRPVAIVSKEVSRDELFISALNRLLSTREVRVFSHNGSTFKYYEKPD